MEKITIICLGTMKNNESAEYCEKYAKWICHHAIFNLIELSEVKTDKKETSASVTAALAKESSAIMSRLPDNAFKIALCVEGKQLTSVQFARIFEEEALRYGHTVFIIGSSHGLDPLIKKQANLCLSLSKLTFPHQLARMLLLEQIYRAQKIRRGERYHK